MVKKSTISIILKQYYNVRDELYITGLYANGTKMNKVENRFLKELFEIAKKGWNYFPT